MYYGNTTAENINKSGSLQKNITLTNCAHRRNICRQKLYGLLLTVLLIVLNLTVPDMELLLIFLPLGLYLMATKKTVLMFERE